MTQDPEDRDLTPEEDARVRALLADLGGETMPPDVAARLDDALAGLVAEREAPEAEVVPLRARWLPLAAAAAAVVVVLGGIGVGVSVLRAVTDGGGSATATSGGGSSDTSAGKALPEQAPASSPPAGSSGGGSSGTASSLPALSSESFARDVTRVLAVHGEAAPQDSSGKALRSPAPACPGPTLSSGESSEPVQLDGRPAVLVVHPAQGGTRLVEAWSCSGDTRLAGARVAP